MILEQYYLDDLKERITEIPEEVFQAYSPYLKQDILDNLHGVLDRLWCIYQKDIDEYNCDESWSFRDALSEVSIPMDINIGDPETKTETPGRWISVKEGLPEPGKRNPLTGKGQQYMCSVTINGISASIALSFTQDSRWVGNKDLTRYVNAWLDTPEN